MNKTTILAIETSCDETGVAVLQKKGNEIKVLAQAVASQTDVHALTGGVVPEVAAREHTQVIGPLIKTIMQKAKVKSQNLDAIAVTVGPGLIPALMVGVQAARTLAFSWGKPIVPVHHIEGHIYSALLQQARNMKHEANNSTSNILNSYFLIPDSPQALPALALIVSGGHTMLIIIRDHLHYEVIGQTRDDAAGEAFDKVARLLNLPYPGGPHLSKLAENGNADVFPFPRPMMHASNFDFSFSGLKTAVLYTLRDQDPSLSPPDQGDSDGFTANIAASFQQAVIDVLVAKTRKAIKQYQPKLLLLAGGVAANKSLREQLRSLSEELELKINIAPLTLCGDNGVMIGQVGAVAYERGRSKKWHEVDAHARIPIEQFNSNL